jgi:chromosome segregation ATPase
MPTSDERLTILEYNFDQFKAEATTYYQEMAIQVTMTKGLTEDAVKRLMQLRIQVDKRFDSTSQQLIEMKQELAGTQQELVGVKQGLAGTQQELVGVKQELAGVKQELAGVKQELAGVKQELAGVKQDISDHTTRLDRIETLLAQVLARLPKP